MANTGKGKRFRPSASVKSKALSLSFLIVFLLYFFAILLSKIQNKRLTRNIDTKNDSTQIFQRTPPLRTLVSNSSINYQLKSISPFLYVKLRRHNSRNLPSNSSGSNSNLPRTHPMKQPFPISYNLEAFFRQMATFANMAYCCPNNGVGKFVTRGDVKADVILDQKENFIVAIFKGPLLSKSQWEKREIVMVPYNVLGKPKNSLIRVDKIWYEDVMSMRSEMFTKIERGVRLTPERRRLLFVGHGVGGAYAAIAGLTWLIERDIDRNYRSTKGDKLDIFTKVITFGAPRFGNVWLARLINKYNGTFVRFTFFNDPTPLFPPIKSGNDILSHHETELWIPMDNCDCSKIWLCEGFFKKSTFDETASSKKEGLDDNPFPEDIFFPYGYEAGENKECSSGQSIANVPPNFLHTGPYFDIVMNDCSMFDFGF